MSRSLTRLPFAKKVKIYEYLNARKDFIIETRPTYQEMAVEAGKALGFEISPFTVGDMARNSVDWEWPNPAPERRMPKERAETFNGNAIKYGALVAKVNRLEKQVERLLAELGVN